MRRARSLQGALVGFVSSLLCALSGSQSFFGLAVSFVSTGLGTGSSVFVSGNASAQFLFHAVAAAGGQQSGQSYGGYFQCSFHNFPLV